MDFISVHRGSNSGLVCGSVLEPHASERDSSLRIAPWDDNHPWHLIAVALLQVAWLPCTIGWLGCVSSHNSLSDFQD